MNCGNKSRLASCSEARLECVLLLYIWSIVSFLPVNISKCWLEPEKALGCLCRIQWVVSLGLQPRMYYFRYPTDGPNRDGCWVQGHPEVVAGNQSGSRIVNHAIAIVKRAPKDYLFPLQSRDIKGRRRNPDWLGCNQLPGRPRTTHIKTSTLRYLQKVARKFDGFQTLRWGDWAPQT